MKRVNRFWQDAASVFETASAVDDGTTANLAILVDERNGLRIVDGAGWTVEALRREYNAATAYTVTRSASRVVVEAHDGSQSCSFQRNFPHHLLTQSSAIPHHLLQLAS